jgi:hypothetical protein
LAFEARDHLQQHPGLLVLIAVLLSTPIVELAEKLKPLLFFSREGLVQH